MGGGLVGLLLMAAVIFLPKLLQGGGLGAGTSPLDPGAVNSPGLAPDPDAGVEVEAGAGGSECDTEIAQIVCGAVEDVQGFWVREFSRVGRDYPIRPTVFYTGVTQTGCGTGNAQTGPFYCPVDSKVYFDLDFLVELQSRFGATGDLAAQYIVAHEYGHHVQNVLGISDQVRELQSRDPRNANAYSVRLELQADCLAGVWAHDADQRGLLEPGEVKEALNAAAAVGDDRIQRQTQGRTDPESWTHGSSEQRQTWFNRGFTTGDSNQCDTFSET
jgi:predicted metalloprotease